MTQRSRELPKTGQQSKSEKLTLQEHKSAKVSNIQERRERITDAVKDIAYAQLGVAGRIYDNVTDIRTYFDRRAEKVGAEAPERWKVLLKRGEKVETGLRKSTTDFTQRIKVFFPQNDFEQRFDQLRDRLNDLRTRYRKEP